MGLGCLNPGKCKCVATIGANILLWEIDSLLSWTDLSAIKAHYNGNGLTAHDSTDWTGTLSDYGLIIWPAANADPTWIGDLSSWAGRLVVTGEYSPVFSGSNTYINALLSSESLSISLANDQHANTPGSFLDVSEPGVATDIADGDITGSNFSDVDGGTPVYVWKTDTSKAVVAREVSSGIDWVVCGDANLFDNTTYNTDWFDILQSAPVP
jgi:hypothetical protein